MHIEASSTRSTCLVECTLRVRPGVSPFHHIVVVWMQEEVVVLLVLVAVAVAVTVAVAFLDKFFVFIAVIPDDACFRPDVHTPTICKCRCNCNCLTESSPVCDDITNCKSVVLLGMCASITRNDFISPHYTHTLRLLLSLPPSLSLSLSLYVHFLFSSETLLRVLFLPSSLSLSFVSLVSLSLVSSAAASSLSLSSSNSPKQKAA